jgi:hypothetical protein
MLKSTEGIWRKNLCLAIGPYEYAKSPSIKSSRSKAWQPTMVRFCCCHNIKIVRFDLSIVFVSLLLFENLPLVFHFPMCTRSSWVSRVVDLKHNSLQWWDSIVVTIERSWDSIYLLCSWVFFGSKIFSSYFTFYTRGRVLFEEWENDARWEKNKYVI